MRTVTESLTCLILCVGLLAVGIITSLFMGLLQDWIRVLLWG